MAQIASGLVILTGCLVLLGWSLNLPLLKGIIPDAATMKANTALCFVLAGVSLGLQTRQRRSLLMVRIAQACAIAVGTVGLLTLCQYLWGVNFGIDEWLFRDDPLSSDTSHPGRMGVNTAINFVLTSITLWLTSYRKKQQKHQLQRGIFDRLAIAQGLAVITGFIALQSIIGYAYNIRVLYQPNPFTTSMALHTALSFGLLSVGVLALHSNQGLMRTVTSHKIGGVIARQFLPAAILIPLVLGWLILQGERAGWYNSSFRLSLMVMSLVIVSTGLIWRNAAVLNRLDRDRIRAADRLRLSEERLQLALQGAGQGIWDWDLESQVLTWDDRCKEILGLPPDCPVTYEWHLNALHPDDRQWVADAATIALRDRTEFNEEYRTFHPNGTTRWVLARGRGFYDAAGNPYRMSGTVLDITDRKEAEIAFQQKAQEAETARQTLDALMTYIPEGITIADAPDVVIRQVSRYGQQLTGRSSEVIEGIPVESHVENWGIFHPDGITPAANEELPLTRAVQQGEVVTNEEWLLRRPDGQQVITLCNAGPIYDGDGEITGGVIAWRDISDRKQAESALQERSNHIQLLYETTRDLLSTEHPLDLVDLLFAKLKPLVGLDVYFNYLLDEQRQMLHLQFSGGISEETARSIEWLEVGQAVCGTVAERRTQIVQPDVQNSADPQAELIRSLGLTAYSCQPLIAQGKLFGTLGFGSRKRTTFTPAETNLFQAICNQIAIALERSELMSFLQQQTVELTQTNRLKDEFLAVLSHELRTPLNPILGWTKLLKEQRLSPAKAAEALDTIERSAKQQLSLVTDLLDVSSVIQGKLSLAISPIDLTAIVSTAIESVQFAAQAKGIAVSVSQCDNEFLRELSVVGDSDRLRQVFWNLLSNAIKFTPAGGRVEVNLAIVTNGNGNRYAQVRVTDNGIGITQAFLPYVFDHFRQADASDSRKHGGLGLGLSIVRHLVELHGGTIAAESPGLEQGATFTVKLPLRAEVNFYNVEHETQTVETNDTKSLPSCQPSAPLPTTTSLSGTRILVVDDDLDNLDLLRFWLQENGAIVTAVSSAREALQITTDNPLDLLISDIGMPEMNGYEFIQQFRALPQNQEIPALAFTAFARYEDQERILSAGFQAYLSKPIDPLELLAVLTQFDLVNPTRLNDLRSH